MYNIVNNYYIILNDFVTKFITAIPGSIFPLIFNDSHGRSAVKSQPSPPTDKHSNRRQLIKNYAIKL